MIKNRQTEARLAWLVQAEAASRRHRFYVEVLPKDVGSTVQLPDDESRHATKVRQDMKRLRSGSTSCQCMCVENNRPRRVDR